MKDEKKYLNMVDFIFLDAAPSLPLTTLISLLFYKTPCLILHKQKEQKPVKL